LLFADGNLQHFQQNSTKFVFLFFKNKFIFEKTLHFFPRQISSAGYPQLYSAIAALRIIRRRMFAVPSLPLPFYFSLYGSFDATCIIIIIIIISV
jgi:hypothetical protein